MKNLVFFVVAVAILGTSLAATEATNTTETVTDPAKTETTSTTTAKPAVVENEKTQHGKVALEKHTNKTINTTCSNKTSCKDCFARKEDGCHYMFFLFEQHVHGLCIEKDTTLSDLEERLFKDTAGKPSPYKTIFNLDYCPSCGKHNSSCEDCLAERDLECSFVHDKKNASICIEEFGAADYDKYGHAVHHGKACPTPKKDQPKPTPPPAQPKTSGFDGSSFFGGIILTVALPTVAFVGYKVYQRRQRGGTHQPF